MLRATVAIRTALTGCTLTALALPAAAAVSLKALANDPCLMVPRATVAELFDAPEAEIEQSELKLSRRGVCTTEWSGANRIIAIETEVQTLENKKKAAQRFKSSTRSVSREEMAKAAQLLRERLDAADKSGKTQKSERAKRTEKSIIGGLAQNPVEFEDISGIGDEARLDVNEGKLVVRKGSAIMNITAYSGPNMPKPEKFDVKSMTQLGKSWKKDILPQRKQQTLELAKVVFKQLK